MSTTTLSRLPSVPELVQLLRTAFPMHWEIHVRSLCLSPGCELPPAELARVTERVFWMVPQMGIKDPAAWLANQARLDALMAAARAKPEASPNIAGDATLQRNELEASKLSVDTAKMSDGSPPKSANRTTKLEPPSSASRSDVLPEGVQLARPAGIESTWVAAESAPR